MQNKQDTYNKYVIDKETEIKDIEIKELKKIKKVVNNEKTNNNNR